MSRIAIIGAGAAGLESLRVLRDHGHEVTVFESRAEPGGHWNSDYEALHLISSANISGFEAWPMPDDYPLFPSRQQMVDYLHGFARHFDLLRDIRFNTPVRLVQPVDGGRRGWEVSTASGTERFDAVVVANGHLSSPVVPEIAERFTGHQRHTADYHNVDDLSGQRVLVVGAGNSGCDVAVDAAQSRRFDDVTISIRHGHRFIPKTLFGRPRREIAILRYTGPWLSQLITRGLMRVSKGTNARYPGLPEPVDPDLRHQLPIANDLLLYWIHHGRIRPTSGITDIEGTQVSFADGTSRSFDTVVWATGYRATFPFLADEYVPREADIPVKYAGCTLLASPLTNLFVIGLTAPRGPQFPVYTRQIELVVRLLALQQRIDHPIVEDFAQSESPNVRIDIIRADWNTEMKRAERLTTRLEERLAPVGVVE